MFSGTYYEVYDNQDNLIKVCSLKSEAFDLINGLNNPNTTHKITITQCTQKSVNIIVNGDHKYIEKPLSNHFSKKNKDIMSELRCYERIITIYSRILW